MVGNDDPKYVLKWSPGDGLTYEELHAAVLGLVGAVAGVAFRLGQVEAATGFSFLVLTVAWGLKEAPDGGYPVAARVTRREPWYFTFLYVASATAGYIAPHFVQQYAPL